MPHKYVKRLKENYRKENIVKAIKAFKHGMPKLMYKPVITLKFPEQKTVY